MPTKTITDPVRKKGELELCFMIKSVSHIPRNIWKLDAKVKLSPTYIIDVPIISHIAGMNRRNGLKLRLPLTKSLTSSELS